MEVANSMSIKIEAKNNGSLHPSIESIFEPLKNQKGVQVFIHGSWADNTTTEFSDIDDFIIIDDLTLTKDELEKIEITLLEVQDEFYRIDPLQHHGHWKAYKSQLKDYNNAVIPLFILEDSICIVGSNTMEAEINHNKSFNTLSSSISGFCVWIDKLFKNYYDGTINIYNLKRLVGSVVLLTPLIKQIQGQNTDKRTAILNAHTLFDKDALPLIQWATDLRTNWNLLTEENAFSAFKAHQKTIPLRAWQKYAEEHAPIIDSKPLSEIVPDSKLVGNFIKQCVNHLDAATLVKKTVEEYQTAYKQVETFAISNKAIMVGQFGEIKHPGISDLDVFICFADEDYKLGQEAVRLFIEHCEDLKYVFTHPPICVAESMLTNLPYVHTIYKLKLSHNQNNIVLKVELKPKYIETLNILWTIFLLPGLEYEVKVADKTGLRSLLLRLKNTHTSIDNLHALNGKAGESLKTSAQLRDQVFDTYEETRKSVEDELKLAYLRLTQTDVIQTPKKAVIGRRLILKEGDYGTSYHKHITILSLPPILYRTLRSYFYADNKEVNQYVKSFTTIANTCKMLEAEMPAVFLLRQYKDIEQPSFIKGMAFKTLSLLPLPLVIKIL